MTREQELIATAKLRARIRLINLCGLPVGGGTVQAPLGQQNAGSIYTAEQFRRMMRMLQPTHWSASSGPSNHGVLQSGDYAVSQNGTPNMSVNVAGGEALVQGTESVNQGDYYMLNDAVLNRTIATADATNPRNDIVGVRVRDAFYSGTFNDADVIVVTGTPAPSPVDPTLPVNFCSLARVRVNAGVSSIVNANITDLRDWIHGWLHPGKPLGWTLMDSTRSNHNIDVTDAGFVNIPRNGLRIGDGNLSSSLLDIIGVNATYKAINNSTGQFSNAQLFLSNTQTDQSAGTQAIARLFWGKDTVGSGGGATSSLQFRAENAAQSISLTPFVFNGNDGTLLLNNGFKQGGANYGAIKLGEQLMVPASSQAAFPSTSWGTVPVKIAEAVVGSAVASVTFSSIPQGFRHLRLYFRLRGDAAATNAVVVAIEWNGDTGANYDIQFLTVNAATLTGSNSAGQAGNSSANRHWVIPAAGTAAGQWNAGHSLFPDYTFVGRHQVLTHIARNDADVGVGEELNMGTYHGTAAATTSLTLLCTSGNLISGVITLEGIP